MHMALTFEESRRMPSPRRSRNVNDIVAGMGLANVCGVGIGAEDLQQ